MPKIVELDKKINDIDLKLKKKIRQKRIREIKENKLKRKQRAIHLFILGNIIKSAGFDLEEENILLGYCLSFKELKGLILDKFKIRGMQVLAEKKIARERKIENFKNNFYENVSYENKSSKKEFSRMVKIGAIFEMAGIDNVELSILVGFILDFGTKNDFDKTYFLSLAKGWKKEKSNIK